MRVQKLAGSMQLSWKITKHKDGQTTSSRNWIIVWNSVKSDISIFDIIPMILSIQSSLKSWLRTQLCWNDGTFDCLSDISGSRVTFLVFCSGIFGSRLSRRHAAERKTLEEVNRQHHCLTRHEAIGLGCHKILRHGARLYLHLVSAMLIKELQKKKKKNFLFFCVFLLFSFAFSAFKPRFARFSFSSFHASRQSFSPKDNSIPNLCPVHVKLCRVTAVVLARSVSK